MNEILNNIRIIENRIQIACQKVGRNPNEVKLLLATKTIAPDLIKIAIQKGYTLIAENRVQELKEKFEALKDIPHHNHFIGHLQTNKIKDILRYNVTCVQSLDRWELAEKLNQRLEFENKNIDVLVQVNTSYEKSKFGVVPEKVIDLVKNVSCLPYLKIKGLMTIGLLSAQQEATRKCFQLLKNIQQEIIALQLPTVSMQELSMGMSGDLETAIQEGATIIRVGTAIFGQRPTPDSFYWNEEQGL
ncbi:MAG TPA: YggS family pyridoxal phosphate-dependent enzyme [Niabella sp.]|nr:YggS family pyridoxal phosphate-dependent enzyme [Niabella sp.]HOZ95649.1 YggS family pyridoxal phosphate-dependent enzyme [Niabella sp.]HQW13889.1 YggS family pyridoxal phosphate-dependent enzyme [Niabella sp.]HQX19218.1 YggS family pyridoxal phosphate-dependent enzyme [Niabella sp.]HQX42250.1 YggS family pyridoxal phosphate-dependent enzyme [Niabella sp.]